MEERIAHCRCGQLSATCLGEPVRVSVCHCLECRKRTGSAFSAQARWPADRVRIEGESKQWRRVADGGGIACYDFCPECGSTVSYVNEGWPGVIAIPLGAFAGQTLPSPRFSVYEHRRLPWVEILGEGVEHSASPSKARAPGYRDPGKG